MTALLYLLWFLALCSVPRAAKAGVPGFIDSIAGSGPYLAIGGGFGGDGGPALSAKFNYPLGIALDPSGNLFIADGSNHRIREVVAATGLVRTVAGTGAPGFGGDGGPATAAELNGPFSVAVDAADDVFIADEMNNRVRRVDGATGIITTYAGNGVAGAAGDGGPATAAQFNVVQSVLLDPAGNLYVADGYDVRKITRSTGKISTYAGANIPGFRGDGGPATSAWMAMYGNCGMALDAQGNLYIPDGGNNAVRKVTAATGIITTVAGIGQFLGPSNDTGDGGQAVAATLTSPIEVAVDCQGNLFIAVGGDRIREVNAATGVIETVAGTGVPGFSGDAGPAIASQNEGVWGLFIDPNGNLLLSDTYNNVIREVYSLACGSASGPPPSPSPTPVYSPTVSPSPSTTPSFTASPTVTPSFTASPTYTASPTSSPTATVTRTFTPSPTWTPTFTASPTRTNTSVALLLSPHYPNPDPAGPAGVWLPYTITTPARMSFSVFNVSGELVTRFQAGPWRQLAGTREQHWNLRNGSGKQVATGVYLCEIQAQSDQGDQATVWEKCAVIP